MVNTFAAFVILLMILAATAVIALLPPKVLRVSVRESIIAVIGDAGLVEATGAMQAALNRADITPVQKRLLQFTGGLAGLPVAVVLLFFTPPWAALTAGGLVTFLGVLWPLSVWKGTVLRKVADGVWRDIPDLVSFLRLNVGEGLGLKEVLDAYVADSPPEAILAEELRRVLALAAGGANLFDQFEIAAARFKDKSLLQVAVALRQIEEADEPQEVLRSLYELIRSVRVAERKKQIKGRVLTSIIVGVVFLLPALLALVLVPAIVTFSQQLSLS